MKNKLLFIGILAALVAIASIGYVVVQNSKHFEDYGFICPDAFTSGEDYLASIGQWVTTYKESYPDATEDEMMAVRAELGEKMECGPSPFGVPATTSIPEIINDVDAAALMEAIKSVEAERPPGISENPTAEEVYKNPYILHIRTALAGYLDGSNNGVEDGVTDVDSSDVLLCGLDAFDKEFYKSKFVVFDANVSANGGVKADIVFVDKPDALFWAWVYQYGDGEYVLRGFCNNGPREDKREEFSRMMKGILPTVDHAL